MFGDPNLSRQLSNWVPLGKISKIYTGTTPSTLDSSNWGGNILWITPAEIDEASFVIFDTIKKLTNKGLKSKSLVLMPKGTVLLSTRAPIGKVAIVGNEMCCNQGFKNFECDTNKLNPIYLYVLLKENNVFLNSIGSGTTFLEISKSRISNLKIPLPKIEIQNKFADFVIEKQKLSSLILNEIKHLQYLFNQKMNDFFNMKS